MKKWLVKTAVTFFATLMTVAILGNITISGLGIILTVAIVLTEHGTKPYLVEAITSSMVLLLLLIKINTLLYIYSLFKKKLKEGKIT